jgi:hypothetical protein
MDLLDIPTDLIRNPLVWAADCCKAAACETEPEARDAYEQLAEEFASIWSEMEGLIGTYEVLAKRND